MTERSPSGSRAAKIIGENVGGSVFGIFRATGALVTRAEVALRVVRGTRVRVPRFLVCPAKGAGCDGEKRGSSRLSERYIDGGEADFGPCLRGSSSLTVVIRPIFFY